MFRSCGNAASRSITVAALALVSFAVAAGSASATVTTQIGVGVGSTGAQTSAYYYDSSLPGAGPTIALSIVRSGAVVAGVNGPGFAYLNVAPSVGDTVQIEKPPGTAFQAVTYDGRPTVDATTCIGSKAISGQRTDAGAEIQASAFSPSSYGSFQDATITTLQSTSFAGTFPRPLAAGENLYVAQSETYPTSYGSFSYYSAREQAVGACPPPPPAKPAAVTRAPKGSLKLLGKRTLRAFLRKGLTTTVSVDQAGKIVSNLFLGNGKVPGHASSLGAAGTKKKSGRKAALIGRGTATALKAGTVKLVIRPTKAAKRIRKKRFAKVVLLTTLQNSARQSTTLPTKKMTLKH